MISTPRQRLIEAKELDQHFMPVSDARPENDENNEGNEDHASLPGGKYYMETTIRTGPPIPPVLKDSNLSFSNTDTLLLSTVDSITMEAKEVLANADEALGGLNSWRAEMQKEEETLSLGLSQLDVLGNEFVDDNNSQSRKAESEWVREIEEHAQASLDISRANAERARSTLERCVTPWPEAERLGSGSDRMSLIADIISRQTNTAVPTSISPGWRGECLISNDSALQLQRRLDEAAAEVAAEAAAREDALCEDSGDMVAEMGGLENELRYFATELDSLLAELEEGEDV